MLKPKSVFLLCVLCLVFPFLMNCGNPALEYPPPPADNPAQDDSKKPPAADDGPAQDDPEESDDPEELPPATILIRDAEDMAMIGRSAEYPIDGTYSIPAGTGEITLTGWTPIGTEGNPFTGSFSGETGAAIRLRGFALGEAEGIVESAGLFGYVRGGTDKPAEIKGLTIILDIEGTGAFSGDGIQYAAVLTGAAEQAVLANIRVSGALRCSKTGGKSLFVGGIAGYLWNSTIQNCVSDLEIESSCDLLLHTGGIAAYMGGASSILDCSSSGNITAQAAAHNSSAGGIIAFVRDSGRTSTIRGCRAAGNVRLEESKTGAYMFYAGGVVGYGGNGTSGGGTGGALCLQSGYDGGAVYCKTGYPYAGGVIGYAYTGSQAQECYARGTVTAEGANLPYAGGVAGYVSAGAKVEDSYSAAAVKALAASKQALAGGVAGAVAKDGSAVRRCYAAGSVAAQIDGASGAGMGGSLGVPAAANAGGIAGSVYYDSPLVEYCAALNSSVAGEELSSGGALKAYRIAGKVDGSLGHNIASASLILTGGAVGDKGPDGQDGEDCAPKPGQEAFVALGWGFTEIWKMEAEGYPVLRWQ